MSVLDQMHTAMKEAKENSSKGAMLMLTTDGEQRRIRFLYDLDTASITRPSCSCAMWSTTTQPRSTSLMPSVLLLDMVDKSISLLQTTFGLDFAL